MLTFGSLFVIQNIFRNAGNIGLLHWWNLLLILNNSGVGILLYC